MNIKLDIDYFPGYDVVFTSTEFQLSQSWFISKYKINKNGDLLPINEWKVDSEWVSIKKYPLRLLIREEKLNKLGI